MSTARPRRRGRPASITREKISRAALKLAREGLEVTMQNVATELHVDVTTLYRHLGNQQELSRLLAEEVAPSPDMLPDHRGKSARAWLHELAWFYWKLMQAQPDLMDFTQSAMDPKHEILDHVVGVLVSHGFSARTASFSYHYLIDVLVGFVYQQIRNEAEKARGGGRFMSYQRNVSAGPRDTLPNVRACELTPEDFETENAFETFLAFTLDGIFAQLDKQPGKDQR